MIPANRVSVCNLWWFQIATILYVEQISINLCYLWSQGRVNFEGLLREVGYSRCHWMLNLLLFTTCMTNRFYSSNKIWVTTNPITLKRQHPLTCSSLSNNYKTCPFSIINETATTTIYIYLWMKIGYRARAFINLFQKHLLIIFPSHN